MMKSTFKTKGWLGSAGLALLLTIFAPIQVLAVWPFAPVPTTPTSQRTAINKVRSQVDWLQNATRTAPRFATGGYGILLQQFNALRANFINFTHTLNDQQLAQGANDLAELDAGLDIIQQAFWNYQEAVAAGQSENLALRDMGQVLHQASRVWLQEFNSVSARLRAG
jgi:hypothetical protein